MSEQPSNESGKQSVGQFMCQFPWLRAAVFLLVLFAVIFPFTSVPEKLKDYAKEVVQAKRVAEKPEKENPNKVEIKKEVTPAPKKVEPVVVEKPVEKPKFKDVQVYLAKEHFEGTKGDMIRMSKGFQFDYKFETEKGKRASEERVDKQSYVAEYKLKVKLPAAATTLEELGKVNEKISSVLPGLESLLEDAKVSDFYYEIYENKLKRMKRETTKLSKLITKHNFYDCETILNLTHKSSGHKIMLIQGDMDVVSDGSDGDRLQTMPDKIVNSTHYQPFTSYGWKKTGKTQNPMISGWKKRIQNAKREISAAGTKPERKQWLKERIKYLKRGIEDMQARSFLVAEYDPFIVLPVNVIRSLDPHAGGPGDYAVVVYGDKVYPAIVGDGGPTYKVGEASLRLAKEINSRASSYSRPVSDLTVTYLVFQGSRDTPKSEPDYKKWHERCTSLLGDIGGLGAGYELHQWEDLLAPKEEEIPATELAKEDAPSEEQP